MKWLIAQKLKHREQRIAFEELLEGIRQEGERVERLEATIREALPEWSLAEVVATLQAMRGISLRLLGVLAEIGDLSRFQNPRKLMGYLGLVPSESLTGDKASAAASPRPVMGGRDAFLSRRPRAREPREAAKGGGSTETRARDCVEA
jgi:transposase